MMTTNEHRLVLDLLNQAISQNAEILGPAVKRLEELETVPGFYVILKDVFCDWTIPADVRLLACIYFKNGITKYWRTNAPNAISPNDKALIRPNLISNFHEPDPKIAKHLSVLIAKIARFDCPKQWPELIPAVMDAVKSSEQIAQHRSLLILNQIVRILSQKMLAMDKMMFQELTSFIFPDMYSVWDAHCQMFFSKVQADMHQDAFLCLDKACKSLKILGRLTVHGCKQPHEHAVVDTFMKMLFDRTKQMLQYRISAKNSEIEELVTKFIVRSTAIMLNLLNARPYSFVDYIPTALEFAVGFAFLPEGEPYLFDSFLINCFNLIKHLINCPEYKPPKSDPESIEDPKNPSHLRCLKAHQMKQAFFTLPTLTAICNKLVKRYFLLTPQELELWNSDPETFATDESGDNSKYSLRPSIETLFSVLFHEYYSLLAPIVVEMIKENAGLASPDDLPALLSKDGVYNAVGIAGYNLYDEIDFDKWVTSSLLRELKIPDSNYRIIRRRVAWLIGNWAGIKLTGSLHPMVYSAMIPLLKSEEDMVVRLTAANTIRIVVECFDFDMQSFLTCLEPIFFALFGLLKEAQLCDTKMRVLHVLYFIVERVGSYIEPYYNSFVQYLPLLWQESEPHNMLRCAVVATLVHLVKAIGRINETEEVYNFMLNVISISTDVNEGCHFYLLEDGLELWLAVLEHSAYPTPKILMLYKNVLTLIESSTEQLELCFSILSAYVLLAPEEIIRVYGQATIKCCSDLLSDIKPEGISIIMSLLELYLKVNYEASSPLLEPLLPFIFKEIVKEEALPTLLSKYLSIISRILMGSREMFVEAIRKLSVKLGRSETDLFLKITDIWLDAMPVLSQIHRRKLLAFALCSLLTADLSFAYDKFCGILLAVTEVLNDITRVDETGAHLDCLIYNDQSLLDDSGSFETEHDFRKKQVTMKDAVHRVVLEDYFKSQLEELKNRLSTSQFEQFVQTVDVETLKQAREYVVL